MRRVAGHRRSRGPRPLTSAAAIDARTAALVAQNELLTHRLVECRFVNLALQRQHVDDERRMHQR